MKASEGKPPVLLSLVFLGIDVAAYAAIAVHTLLSRRRYGRVLDEQLLRKVSLPVEFFVATPAAIYASAILLLVVGLIVKECAIERKGLTLWVNIAALLGALALFAVYLGSVQFPFERLLAP